MYKHLLVPIDGSLLGTELVRQSVLLARSLGAQITFFHAEEGGGSSGIAAPKLASMLCRARRSAICAFTCSGNRSYATAMLAHIVSPPTGGHSMQRSTQPMGGLSRQVASVCQAFS